MHGIGGGGGWTLRIRNRSPKRQQECARERRKDSYQRHIACRGLVVHVKFVPNKICGKRAREAAKKRWFWLTFKGGFLCAWRQELRKSLWVACTNKPSENNGKDDRRSATIHRERLCHQYPGKTRLPVATARFQTEQGSGRYSQHSPIGSTANPCRRDMADGAAVSRTHRLTSFFSLPFFAGGLPPHTRAPQDRSLSTGWTPKMHKREIMKGRPAAPTGKHMRRSLRDGNVACLSQGVTDGSSPDDFPPRRGRAATAQMPAGEPTQRCARTAASPADTSSRPPSFPCLQVFDVDRRARLQIRGPP